MFAGHLPTMRFDLKDWQTMPVWSNCFNWPGDGFLRTSDDRGRPIVAYNAPVDSGEVSYAVRPIVCVKMGRRIVSDAHQILYEWWNERERIA